MKTIRTVAELREALAPERRAGRVIGLVPTMGSLHDGHLALLRRAREQCDVVVMSLFVNPAQFGPNEDFEAYPRDEARDAGLLAGAGCDLLYAPSVAEVYPVGASTTVTVGGVAEPLEGAARPGHFAGVATIVAKLLNQCGPDVAVFGEKDFQQLAVIRRLVADLDIPVEIVGAPTQRADDGLALSSRNAYLSPEERAQAPVLHQVLQALLQSLRNGESVAAVESVALDALARAGFREIDYVEVRDPATLERLGPGPVEGPFRVLAAARLGRTRLIDNVGD